eukprot:CAMPEP_0117671678 /NCGR_PEP_ID=MMETSP0804-20121206/13474_1 /TAXON_ID=1074897 /ORGANISM="Tetraselmis astigmatica, Strain CCMP880" /LENGTH=53 /DNA_ID=CAMNT_0005480179 /DNA_START=303 /DNA_END=461 /DNA_ORIENTATION=-
MVVGTPTGHLPAATIAAARALYSFATWRHESWDSQSSDAASDAPTVHTAAHTF